MRFDRAGESGRRRSVARARGRAARRWPWRPAATTTTARPRRPPRRAPRRPRRRPSPTPRPRPDRGAGRHAETSAPRRRRRPPRRPARRPRRRPRPRRRRGPRAAPEAGIPGGLLPEELSLWTYDADSGTYVEAEGDATQPYTPNLRRAGRADHDRLQRRLRRHPVHGRHQEEPRADRRRSSATSRSSTATRSSSRRRRSPAPSSSRRRAPTSPSSRTSRAAPPTSVMRIWDDAKIPVANIDVWHPNGIFFGANNYESGLIGGRGPRARSPRRSGTARASGSCTARTPARARSPTSAASASSTACARPAATSPDDQVDTILLDAGTRRPGDHAHHGLADGAPAGRARAGHVDRRRPRRRARRKALPAERPRRLRGRPGLRRHRHRGAQGRAGRGDALPRLRGLLPGEATPTTSSRSRSTSWRASRCRRRCTSSTASSTSDTIDRGLPASAGGTLLELEGVGARASGPSTALRDVSFRLDAAEAVGLIGDNGAGKSTLVKVLSGVFPPSGGRRCGWTASPSRSAAPLDARAAGIEIIHQDLALCDDLDVAANVFLGREPRRRLGPVALLDRRRMAPRGGRRDARSSAAPSPVTGRPVRDLSGGERQLVAVARALEFRPRRAAARRADRGALGGEDRPAARPGRRASSSRGVAILLVSHRFTDILHVCDRVRRAAPGPARRRAAARGLAARAHDGAHGTSS